MNRKFIGRLLTWLLLSGPGFSQANREVFYYHTDHLGSVRMVSDGQGGVVRVHDYLPYGEAVTAAAEGDRFGFTGQPRDTETGLDYFGARHYGSTLGRFMSPDEFTGGPVDLFTGQQIQKPGPLPYADITNPQSLNKYAYGLNNSLRYTDPDGHFPLCADPISCGIEFGAVGTFLGGPGPGTVVGGLVGAAVGGAIVYFGYKAYSNYNEDQKAKENAPPATPPNVEQKAKENAPPETGGGKNAPKVNPDRVKSAQDRVQDLIKQRDALNRKPNKTPADKQERDRLDRQIKRERDRMKKSEEHSRREKH